MTPPPRARVSWKDGRPPTTVYLTGTNKFSFFTDSPQTFWDYRDRDQNRIGPEWQSSRKWAWEALQTWATKYEAGAAPYPPPEESVEPEDDDEEEMPTFYPEDPDDREPESREDREERMEGM